MSTTCQSSSRNRTHSTYKKTYRIRMYVSNISCEVDRRRCRDVISPVSGYLQGRKTLSYGQEEKMRTTECVATLSRNCMIYTLGNKISVSGSDQWIDPEVSLRNNIRSLKGGCCTIPKYRHYPNNTRLLPHDYGRILP